MKNACIVLKKNVTSRDGGECAVLDAFNLCGYPFEEIRFLSQVNERKIKEDLTSLKGIYDNVLFAGFGVENDILCSYRYVSSRFLVSIDKLSEINVAYNVAVGHYNVIFLTSFNEVQAVYKT